MFFAKKKIADGSVPLKYKRGKIKNGVYRSECLGYCVKIGEGLEVKDEAYCESQSEPNDICDFFGILANGVRIGVHYRPSDGSIQITDNATREMLGKAISQGLNEQRKGEAESTNYGIVEFCGKPCSYSILHFTKNGEAWTSEFYEYYSTYVVISFGFIYKADNQWYVDEAKALLSALT